MLVELSIMIPDHVYAGLTYHGSHFFMRMHYGMITAFTVFLMIIAHWGKIRLISPITLPHKNSEAAPGNCRAYSIQNVTSGEHSVLKNSAPVLAMEDSGTNAMKNGVKPATGRCEYIISGTDMDENRDSASEVEFEQEAVNKSSFTILPWKTFLTVTGVAWFLSFVFIFIGGEGVSGVWCAQFGCLFVLLFDIIWILQSVDFHAKVESATFGGIPMSGNGENTTDVGPTAVDTKPARNAPSLNGSNVSVPSTPTENTSMYGSIVQHKEDTKERLYKSPAEVIAAAKARHREATINSSWNKVCCNRLNTRPKQKIWCVAYGVRSASYGGDMTDEFDKRGKSMKKAQRKKETFYWAIFLISIVLMALGLIHDICEECEWFFQDGLIPRVAHKLIPFIAMAVTRAMGTGVMNV